MIRNALLAFLLVATTSISHRLLPQQKNWF